MINQTQAAILSKLSKKQTGRQLRKFLSDNRIHKSGPSFYQFMARLEKLGLVEGWYEESVVGTQRIKERCYKITGDGQISLNELCEFNRFFGLV